MSTSVHLARMTFLRVAFSTLILSSSVLGVFALLLLPNLAQSPAAASFPGAIGKIAFVSDRDGGPGIFLMNVDGSDVTRITFDDRAVSSLRSSPDGTKLVFEATDNAENIISVINIDGSGETELVRESSDNGKPTWSPDGMKIAFMTARDGNPEIYTMNSADGSGPTRLTSNPAVDTEPSWSPDGTKIAFASNRDGNSHIYTMNADGSNPVELTHDGQCFRVGCIDSEPDWSPDGSTLLFTRNGNIWIYLFSETTLFLRTADASAPSWSPDGAKFAFMSDTDGNPEIYAMNAQHDLGLVRLTNNAGDDSSPAYIPMPSGFVVSDEESCLSLPTSGAKPTWDESTKTCTLPEDSTMRFFAPDISLTISEGVTLINEGTIGNLFFLYNNGTLDVNGVINAVKIENNLDATINNNEDMSLVGSLVNRGTINNYALLQDEGKPLNEGVINNHDVIRFLGFSATSSPTGVINNFDGALIDQGSPEFDNLGTLNNYAGAVLNNMGYLSNIGGAVINNYGSILNDTPFSEESDMTFGLISNSAVINQFCGATLSGIGMFTGNAPIDVCPTGVIADATTQATGQSMYEGTRIFYGEKFGTAAGILGHGVDCATVELRRHDSPTGMTEIGFYDSNMNLLKQFGTIDVSTLTTGYKAYEFCLPNTDSGHVIQENQILAVVYDGGDPVNRIDVRRSNTGAGPDYDGVDSYHVNYDAFWHIYNTEGNSRDLLFKLTNS